MMWAFETLSPTPSDTPSPTKSLLPNLSQTVPQSMDQVFKHMSEPVRTILIQSMMIPKIKAT